MSATIHHLPRRQLHRQVTVWKWPDGTYTAALLGAGGELITLSRTCVDRPDAEGIARRLHERYGMPLVLYGLATSEARPGPERVA